MYKKHLSFINVLFLNQVKEKWESRSNMNGEDIASLELQIEGSQWII